MTSIDKARKYKSNSTSCEEYVTNDGDFGIDFTISQSTQDSALDYDGIVVETEAQFSLNPTQSKVFRLITNNVVKRLKHEQVEQIIAYVGGPGGTGKSQILRLLLVSMKRLSSGTLSVFVLILALLQSL